MVLRELLTELGSSVTSQVALKPLAQKRKSISLGMNLVVFLK